MLLTNRRAGLICLLLALLTLAACGGQAAPSRTAASVAPSAASAASPSVVASPSAAAGSAAASTGLSQRYAGIPQSKTSEGYYVLGDPDAPVVLTHYSDFL